MRNFTNKNFIQKLIIVTIIVILSDFCLSTNVQAASNDDTIWGGKIMSLLVEFATGIADVAGTLAQFGVTGRWIYAVDAEKSGKVVENSATQERGRRFLG